MEKEDLFNDDFLKQFKTGEELNNFLKQLQKRGIENKLSFPSDQAQWNRYIWLWEKQLKNGQYQSKIGAFF